MTDTNKRICPRSPVVGGDCKIITCPGKHPHDRDKDCNKTTPGGCPACIPYTPAPAPLTDTDKRCKCAAHNSDECICGAWDDMDPQRLKRERDEARAEGKRMRETIQRYGHHDGYCDLRNYGRAVPVPCQCGFDAALSPAPAPEVCVWTGGGGAARNYKSGCMSYYWWESVPASGVCTWCGKPIEIKDIVRAMPVSPAPAPEVCVWQKRKGNREWFLSCSSHTFDDVSHRAECPICGKRIEIKEVTP